MKVKICNIVKDEDLQPRFKLDTRHVTDLKHTYLENTELPPISLFEINNSLFLVDGFHRVKAAELAGLEELDATITNGTKLDAICAASKANLTHGLKLNGAEATVYLKRILAFPELKDMSGAELSKLTGYSKTHINNIKRSMNDPNYKPKQWSSSLKDQLTKANKTIEQLAKTISLLEKKLSKYESVTPQSLETASSEPVKVSPRSEHLPAPKSPTADDIWPSEPIGNDSSTVVEPKMMYWDDVCEHLDIQKWEKGSLGRMIKLDSKGYVDLTSAKNALKQIRSNNTN